jgi:hypothetical protein
LIEDKEKEYEEEYEVDQVSDYDHEKDRYLVSWKRVWTRRQSWKPAAHLRNAPDMTADYCSIEARTALLLEHLGKRTRRISRMKRTSVHS